METAKEDCPVSLGDSLQIQQNPWKISPKQFTLRNSAGSLQAATQLKNDFILSYSQEFSRILRSNSFKEHLSMAVSNLVYNWDKVFKDGPSKICRRQPLKRLSSTTFKIAWSVLEYFASTHG